MGETKEILSAEQMKERYGPFYESSLKIQLDERKVPEQCRPLLPYAEFWGIADDWMRQDLVDEAPREAKEDLREVVAGFESALDEWLAGPEADNVSPSDEYIAFTAIRMAADYV